MNINITLGGHVLDHGLNQILVKKVLCDHILTKKIDTLGKHVVDLTTGNVFGLVKQVPRTAIKNLDKLFLGFRGNRKNADVLATIDNVDPDQLFFTNTIRVAFKITSIGANFINVFIITAFNTRVYESDVDDVLIVTPDDDFRKA